MHLKGIMELKEHLNCKKEMPLTHNLYTKLKSLGLLFLYMIIGPAYTFITARN